MEIYKKKFGVPGYFLNSSIAIVQSQVNEHLIIYVPQTDRK